MKALTHARQENVVSKNTLRCISELCVQMARTLGRTLYVTRANCAIWTVIKLKEKGADRGIVECCGILKLQTASE